MSLGLVIFAAGDALGAASAVISCRRTSRYRGRGAAAREAAVLGLSVGVYSGVCVAWGYGMWPQLLGCLLGAVVLFVGLPWIPSVAEYFAKGDD